MEPENTLTSRDATTLAPRSSYPPAQSPATSPPTPEQKTEFWRNGVFPPVSEEVTVTELTVDGSIPTDLNGFYYRNGPNNWQGAKKHFFQGDGMIHGLQLENGKANWYRNRYVQTPFLYKKPNNFKTVINPAANQSNVSLVHHAGKLLSLGEAGLPYIIRPTDLSTVGPFSFNDKLKGAMTAHPKVDPVSGEMFFFGYNAVRPYLTYYRVDTTGELVQKEEIETTSAALMHDFAITENFVIFMQFPIVFSWWAMLTGNHIPFKWRDSAPSRIGVMPKTGNSASMQWFDVDPAFAFHVMNAYEEGETVILDVARYERLWVKNSSDFDYPAHLSRYTLDRETGRSSVRKLNETRMEFPQINRKFAGRLNRFGYSLAIGMVGEGKDMHETVSGVMKYDLQTGETQKLETGGQYLPAEPFFVPAANATNEDDGYLLTFVYDANKDSTSLWIIDAHQITNVLAKVHLQARVPQGFHGLWLPAENT